MSDEDYGEPQNRDAGPPVELGEEYEALAQPPPPSPHALDAREEAMSRERKPMGPPPGAERIGPLDEPPPNNVEPTEPRPFEPPEEEQKAGA